MEFKKLADAPKNSIPYRQNAVLVVIFGLTFSWFMYCYNVTSSINNGGIPLSGGFKQSVELSNALLFVAAAFICWRSKISLFQKNSSHNIIFVGIVAVSALACAALLALPFSESNLRVQLLILAGFCGAVAYVVPFAGWVRIVFDFTFSRLLSITGCGLIVTGAVCNLLYLLPQVFSLFFAALLPIFSILFIYAFTEKPETLERKQLTSTSSPSPLILLALVLVGSIVFTILKDKWMPISTMNWMFFFMPCGLVIFLFAEVMQKRCISIEVSFAFCISAACCVALLALTPLFQSEFTYGFVFMVAWMLRLFAFDGSIWYGSQCHSRGLSATFGAFGAIFFFQFLCRFITPYFGDQDLALLVIALVLLAFALILFLLVHIKAMQSPLQQSSNIVSQSNSDMAAFMQKFGLTDREQDVMKLLSKGFSVKAIADKLVVSENTVKFHRTNIYRKLNVKSRQELIDLITASTHAR